MPAAVRFMFHFEPQAISAPVILAAMGHAFFTLSLGMGAIMTYGSYLERGTSIARTCLYITVADTGIALLAGLSIFAIVFAQGLEPAAGPGLILQTLPLAFAQMPLGNVIGVLFFVLVVFAAWTSAISLIEPATAFLVERFGLGRKPAVAAVCFIAWCIGIAVALSFNLWSEIKLFGLNIFDLLDTLTTKILMPLAGLLKYRMHTYRWLSLFVWVYFAEGVVRATGDRGIGAMLAGLEIVLCIVLFAACAAQVRWRLAHAKETPT